MTRGFAGPVAVFVATLSVGCGSSSSVTAPVATAAAPAETRTGSVSSFETTVVQAAGVVTRTANIDGFRVHPDPGDDGVIRVFEGQPVIVNAADIASAPPAPETFLIVNWGDDGNQRVSCGPCRLEHLYATGTYTLVATADDLQPVGGASASTNRSITLTIEVTPGREAPEIISPYASFGFRPTFLAVGEFGEFFLPRAFLTNPPDNILFRCSTAPALPFIPGPPVLLPRGLVLPLEAVTPGRCTFTILSHDEDGNSFRDESTITIVP